MRRTTLLGIVFSALLVAACGKTTPDVPVVDLEQGLSYSGELTRDDPTFIKPDIGFASSEAQRRVPYETFAFRVPKEDFYEILSVQRNFDGYLDLYTDSFNPAEPSQNLLVYSDDFDGSYDPKADPAARSRIVYNLEPGKVYVVVTNACGGNGASCGPDTGSFTNTITAGATAPPPTFVLPTPNSAAYDITLRFGGAALSKAQQKVFEDAAARWSKIITKDLQNIQDFNLPPNFVFEGTGQVTGELDDVFVDVVFEDIDGAGGVLGAASALLVRRDTSPDAALTTYGYMYFDISEFGNGGFFDDDQQFQDTVVHEMGHVLGIGTLWDYTGNTEGVIRRGDPGYPEGPPTVSPGLPNPDYDPHFTGGGAVAEYQKFLDMAGYPKEATVPVANTGGPGNYNGHWRELVFANELMTPYAGGAERLSRMTAASLGDLGYTVDIGSSAVDADYTLPPPRIPGVFRQTAPNSVTYAEGKDFVAATEASKASVAGGVIDVDLNLGAVDTSTSACQAADFNGLRVSAKIALVRRGGCTFETKVLNAVNAGAVGVVIMNQSEAEDRKGLLDPALGKAAGTVPVVFITYDLGFTLAGTGGLEVALETGSAPVEPLRLRPDTDFVRGEVLVGPLGTVSSEGHISLHGANPKEVFTRVREAVQALREVRSPDR
ncbi:hypothetical protein BH24DEI2_BH24DEI2_11320 [soil metagenome]